jgi:hypothetical protein
MTTIASSVLTTIAQAGDVVACTYAGGYVVRRDGSRVLFPPGRVIKERRNPEGRCTYQLLEYADGSRIETTWHPTRGATRKEVSP